MPCMFCGHKKLSKEHIIGQWAQKYIDIPYDPKARVKHHVTVSPNQDKVIAEKGLFSNSGNSLSITTKAVCRNCNSGWMSQIEERMSEIFPKHFTTTNMENFTKFDQFAIAKWGLLKFCLHQKAYRYHEWDRSMPNSLIMRRKAEEKEIWDNFFKKQAIPSELDIFVCKTYPGNFGAFQYIPYPNQVLVRKSKMETIKFLYFFMISLGEMTIIISSKSKHLRNTLSNTKDDSKKALFLKIDCKSNTRRFSATKLDPASMERALLETLPKPFNLFLRTNFS